MLFSDHQILPCPAAGLYGKESSSSSPWNPWVWIMITYRKVSASGGVSGKTTMVQWNLVENVTLSFAFHHKPSTSKLVASCWPLTKESQPQAVKEQNPPKRKIAHTSTYYFQNQNPWWRWNREIRLIPSHGTPFKIYLFLPSSHELMASDMDREGLKWRQLEHWMKWILEHRDCTTKWLLLSCTWGFVPSVTSTELTAS